jgi:hypothetical protein
VGADDCRIKNQDIKVGIAEYLDNGGEPTAIRPAIKASPLAVPISQSLGQVTPWRTGAGDPQDGIDKPPIVVGDSAVLSRLAGQQVLDTFPVRIRNLMATKHKQPSVAGTEGRHLPKIPDYCPHDLVQSGRLRQLDPTNNRGFR